MMEGDLQIVEPEHFRGGFGDSVTYRSVVMGLLQKLSMLACNEWHGGYWDEYQPNPTTLKRTYIQATHESYSNGVMHLAALLMPEFDQQMKDSFETARKKEAELKDSYRNDDVTSEKFLQSHYYYERVELMFELFIQLSMFLNRIDYLQAGVTVEEI